MPHRPLPTSWSAYPPSLLACATPTLSLYWLPYSLTSSSKSVWAASCLHCCSHSPPSELFTLYNPSHLSTVQLPSWSPMVHEYLHPMQTMSISFIPHLSSWLLASLSSSESLKLLPHGLFCSHLRSSPLVESHRLFNPSVARINGIIPGIFVKFLLLLLVH